ncbi:hypothetical protein SAMN05444392_102246 [Seinonella peptonophila]|uniref:Uncharacterized protein n=1 Tax=Seinonella peptonophila TaxID=112248 RepID=A0A1M4V9F7_9BACL|nr:hypothetical protein [Seinonella peptonophila]SHE65584.1 hypothetical protein SAMN05444392_102246 [Seinonella peptonophila]
MDEQQVEKLIQKSLDQKLSADEQHRLEEELSMKPELQQMREDYQAIEKELRQLPKRTPPISIVDQVVAKLDQEQMKKRWFTRRRWKVGLGIVAAMMVSLTGYLWSQDQFGSQSSLVENKMESTPQSPQTNLIKAPKSISPNGKWVAFWQGQTVMIQTIDGKEVYRHTISNANQIVRLKWISVTVLEVSYQNHGKEEQFLLQYRGDTFR